MQKWLIACLFLVPFASSLGQTEPVMPSRTDPESVFTEAWLVVRSAFYDPNFGGADWESVREELLPKARAATKPAEVSQVINEALGRLKASHTAHYTQEQREYYELLDVFYPDGVPARPSSKIHPGVIEYTGIGLAATVIGGHTFAADVYSGGPADVAGIFTGDELIGVEGGAWGDVVPFRGRDGVETTVTIQRTRDEASRREVKVTPRVIHPREMFADAVTASARVVKRGGKAIGYIRVRSYAHPDYHERLKDALATKFSAADAVVIDLRGGWGGASPQYMDIFNPVSPELEYISRDGTSKVFSTTWRKPVVLVIDAGTRSGKEVLAYAFKRHKIGRLVGEKTAGAVLAGTPRPLADGSLLYIAVSSVKVDGRVLEGTGVEPDVAVARELPYSAGKDPQMEAAIDEAVKACGAR